MNISRTISIVTIVLTSAYAQTSDTNSSYVDEAHTTISDKIIDWSKNTDITLNHWLGNDDRNMTIEKVDKRENNSTKVPLTVDKFFQSRKYLDETDNSFLRLRIDNIFQTKNSNDFNLRINAQIPLCKTRENFKFFIDNLNLDNAKNIFKYDGEDNNPVPDIGIQYFIPDTYNVRSKYSLGFSGISPFIYARYDMPIEIKNWLIDPVQTFRYSVNEKFEEETNIYFDRSFSDLSLFRIQLHRKTQTEMKGMDYGLALQYYWTHIENIGFSLSQSFVGNTKYTYNSTVTAQTRMYSSINNYVTSFRWRENIWRKWFYYEVSPSVNFDKAYEFKANYSIRVLFDFYFGDYD